MFKKISPLLLMLPVLAVPQASAATKLARSIPLCSWVPCGQMRCGMYIMNARLGMLQALASFAVSSSYGWVTCHDDKFTGVGCKKRARLG